MRIFNHTLTDVGQNVSDMFCSLSLICAYYAHLHVTLPYLTLPSGWAGCYTCPTLKPYQLGQCATPM